MKTVLVSGAGVAGLTVAYWLRRHGFAVTVVETSVGIRPGGHAVDIRGAAREVLTQMGLLPAVRAATLPEQGIVFLDARGRRLAEMPADAFGGEGVVADLEILRGDLVQILFEATRDEVEYRFADRVTGLAQDAGREIVTFADGATRAFDVVVGADGVRSGVRRIAFGPDADFVRPLGLYTSSFTVPDPGDLDGWFLMCNVPGGRAAAIRPDRGGTAKAMLSFASPVLDGERDPDRQRGYLRDAFAGVGWRVPAMLAALPGAPDFYFDAMAQVHVGEWGRGHVAVLGDAAYAGSPLTGLGTATSLVGAYVLAGELAATPHDPPAAFARYQAEIRDYVRRAQALPPGGARGFAPRTRTMIRLRGWSIAMATRWPMRALLARQFGKADAVTLPDYGPTASLPL